VRTKTLRVLRVDGELEVLRMLTDRREALTRRRVQTVNRLQALLAELLPGQAKKDITPLQAKAVLASGRPRDVAGKRRRRVAAEELSELIAVEVKIKKATAELKAIVRARGGRLTPAHRHFGSATSRTRTAEATPGIDDCEDRRREEPRSDRLTTEGSQYAASPG
jgi:transposase